MHHPPIELLVAFLKNELLQIVPLPPAKKNLQLTKSESLLLPLNYLGCKFNNPRPPTLKEIMYNSKR